MALALACMMPACIQAAPGDAARKVIMRTYGIDTRNINFKQLPSNGTDRYAYDCQNGKLSIRFLQVSGCHITRHGYMERQRYAAKV